MSTNASIGIELKSGKVKAVYCHFDGYYDGVGKTLLEHYKDRKKVEKLISLGDLSSLGEEIGSKHDFNKAPDNECNFYGRDRNEDNTEADVYSSKEDYLESSDFSYTYLFSIENKWLAAEDSSFILLTEALELDTIEEE